MLRGKNVLLGVSAGIAAYKTAQLCRELIKKGANVKVLMTPDSIHFITPLTLSTLSKNKVYVEYFDKKTGEWNNHVKLAQWADFFLLAPATSNTLAKMAHAHSDNLLLATYLSMENQQEVYFAPAMDLDMYAHPANQENIKKLQEFGNKMIPPESGELASGLFGLGRMAEVEHIINFIDKSHSQLKGKKVLITAGPTYEQIDPVRFIGNHSSGKMGIALAQTLINRGAEVTLVCGPVSIAIPKVAKLISVTSAEEMFQAVKKEYKHADCLIFAAAVADYTPIDFAQQKIKKAEQAMKVELKPTTDILKYVGENKKEHQLLVGFALETENGIENAKKKIKSKNLDFIVLNMLTDKETAFGYDTNQITILSSDNKQIAFELKNKTAVAEDIVNTIAAQWID